MLTVLSCSNMLHNTTLRVCGVVGTLSMCKHDLIFTNPWCDSFISTSCLTCSSICHRYSTSNPKTFGRPNWKWAWSHRLSFGTVSRPRFPPGVFKISDHWLLLFLRYLFLVINVEIRTLSLLTKLLETHVELTLRVDNFFYQVQFVFLSHMLLGVSFLPWRIKLVEIQIQNENDMKRKSRVFVVLTLFSNFGCL